MDEACDRIFEMVKSKINEPKKKRRKRTYTAKQMETMKQNLAKGRAVLKARRDAKKSQNVKLEIKAVKKEPKVERVEPKVEPKVVSIPETRMEKSPSPKPQPKPKVEPRSAPQFEVSPVEEVSYNINFSEGGSLW